MRILVVAFAALSVACPSKSSTDTESPEPTAKQPTKSGKDRMLEHFLELTAIERAVVRGDLAAVKTHGIALAEPRPDDPADWAPHVADIKEAAKTVQAAKTLTAATAATAEVIRTCAACHEALSVEFQPNWVPDPPPPTSVEQKMRRHQWGLDLMRLSLVFKKDAEWQRAADVLTSAPLHPREITSDGPIDPDAVERANALRDIAKAAAKQPQERRLETYAALLGTCVGCHAGK